MVQGYVRVWRGSAGFTVPAAADVLEARQQHVQQLVHPWPTLEDTAVPWRDDGRFAKAFPLTFVTGVGDYHQPRLRSDFTTLDWAQHIFRFFTGHVQTGTRGSRVLWAVFNLALGELSSEKCGLVHARSGYEALTKAQLPASRDHTH